MRPTFASYLDNPSTHLKHSNVMKNKTLKFMNRQREHLSNLKSPPNKVSDCFITRVSVNRLNSH